MLISAFEESTASSFDPESGEYNIPYLARYLQGRGVAVVHLFYRELGFLSGPSLERPVQAFSDLAGGRVRFVNRQSGSGTRLLMDHLLAEQGLAPEAIAGWSDPPEDSHLAVAAALAGGTADAGPGIEAAARAFGLGFVPLIDEDYYLVCLKDALAHPAVQKLRAALADPAWVLALLPVGVGALIMILNQGYFLRMWNDASGQRMVLLAIGLEGVGALLLYRLAQLR